MSLRSFIRRTHLLIQEGLYATRKTSQGGPERSPELTRLEERVLFSASALAPVVAQIAEVGGSLFVDSAPTDDATAFHVPDQQILDLVADSVLPAQDTNQNGNSTGDEQTLELVFLDSSISNLDQMMADLRVDRVSNTSRTLEFVVLDATKDGIAQITSALLRYNGVDGLHIVSHGNGEQVQLGSTTLSLNTLDRYRTAINAWQYAMSDKADILIYGCDLSASAGGQSLLQELSQLTNTDVAASEELSGNTNSASDVNQASVRQEIVILDPGVQNSEELRERLLAQQEQGRELTFFVLDASRDGVEQIDEILSRYQNLDAVHVLSHGTAQGLQLGSTWLDATTIISYSDSIRGWQNAFNGDTDLLLYGCDLAASDAGRSLVDSLGQLTGADVAASTELTGYALFGGDWKLEYQTGEIETSVAASLRTQTEWLGLMAVSVDATSTGVGSGTNNVTFSHTTTAAGNRLMLVGISMDADDGPSVSNVSYGAQSLTFVGSRVGGSSPVRIEIWTLVNPNSGTANVVVNLSSDADGFSVGATTFTGVDQTSSLGSFVSAIGTSSTPTVDVSSATGELVYDVVAGKDGGTLTEGSDQKELWDVNASSQSRGAASIETGAATVTMSWTKGSSLEWAIGGVSIRPVANIAPTISLSGAAVNYTENDPATIIDATATASDPDSENFDTGTLAIDFTANGTTNDRLAIRNEGTGAEQIGVSGANVTYGGVTIGTFTGGTDGSTPLVITFNASSTPVAAQALMRNITCENVSESPSTLDRTVRFVLTDGDGETSNTATKTIGVIAVNDAPTIKNNGDARAYPIGSPATVIDTSLTASDSDTATLTGGTITISSGYATGQDVLAFTNQSGINGSWSSGTGVLTLSGTATLAQYETALRSITFQTSAGSSGLRLIAFQVSDGTASSLATVSTVSVGSEVASLWISGTSNTTTSAGTGGLSYNDGQAVRFANPNLALGSGTSNGTFSNVFNIDTFTGDGNSDLKGLHYVNSAVTIGTTNAVTVQKGDVLLSVSSNETLGGVSVTSRDIVLFRPTILGNYSSGTFSVLLREPGSTGGNVRDFALVETAMTVGGTSLQSGDFLMVFSGGSYDKDVSLFRATTMSTNPTGGTLSVLVDGDGSSGIGFGARILGLELVQQNTTLGGVSLTQGQLLISLDSSDVVGTNNLSVTKFDVFTMTITATGNITSVGTANMLLRGADVGLSGSGEKYDALALVAVFNTAPTATNLSAAEIYTEDTDLNLTDIVVSDVDSISVTVTLTLSNIAAGSLNTGTSGAVTSTYIAGTGVWTASGAIADVNTLLADLTFTPTLNYNGNFTIATSVSDGVATPITGSKTMTGTAVNDAPVHTVPGTQLTNSNTPLILTGANAFSIVDVDAGTGDIEVTLAAIYGTLTLNGTTNLSFTSGDGISDSSMVFRGKLSDINTALDGLTFDPTPGLNGSASISIKTDDLGNTGSGGNLSVKNVVSVIVGNATMTYQEGVNSYAGTEDTELQNDNPATSFGNATSISVDLQNGSLESQVLIQFANLFGTGPRQIPIGSVINSASLTLNVFDTADSGTTIWLHRMLATWNESSTWNSLTNGIQRNNIEAASAADSTMTLAEYTGPQTFYGLKSTVQAWADGGANNGWVIVTNSIDGWDFYSSEDGTASRRPVLTISYTAPTPPQLDLDANNSSGSAGSGFSTTFTEDGPAVVIADSDAILTDADDSDLQSMTITLTNPLDGAAESLSANTAGTSISASYNPGTGILTLTNTDTLANYLQVLKSVTYQNSSNTPNTTTRIITVVGHDGFADSNIATASIAIGASNDAPVAIADHYTTPQLTTLNVTAANGLLANDGDEDGNSLTVILVSGPGYGTLTLAADGSLRYTPQGIFTGSDTFSYQVTDGLLNSAVITVTVDVFRTTSTGSGAGSTGSSSTGTGSSGGTSSNGSNNGSGSTAGGDLNTTVNTNAVPSDIRSLHRNSANGQLLFDKSSGFEIDSNANVVSLADSQLNDLASIIFSTQGAENQTSATSTHRSAGNYQNVTRFVTDLFGGTVLAAPVDAIVSSAFFTFDWSPHAEQQAEATSARITSEKVVVGSTAVVTTSLSVGYVIWILRGGSLLTAFASALPAWSSFDPLPVLKSFEKQNKDDDETFLSMVSRNAVNVVNRVVK